MEKELWEILVPKNKNNGDSFRMPHHWKWDEYVKNISGGLTIMRVAKGEWLSRTEGWFKDYVIPVRIICTLEEINDIIDFTIKHYNQEAVMAYKVSEHVIIKHKEKEHEIL